MKQKGIFLFFCTSLLASLASASGYNISGKIIKPDGTAFSGTAVPFAIELVNATGSCVIYKEEFTVNMADTKGAFHVVFGGPTANRTYPTSGTLTVESALKNTTGTPYTCLDNTTYTPAATDERSIRVTFNDGNTWQIFSQQALKSVPSATSAKYATTADSAQSANSVATFQASNLLRSSSATLPDLTATGAANLQTLLTRFTDIQNLIDGNSSTYLKVAPTETDPTVKPFAKANLPTCTAGTVLTSSDGTNLTCATDATGGGGGSLPAGTAGKYLKYDGANWISSGISVSDVSTLSTSLSTLSNKVDKGDIPTNCTASESLKFNSISNTWGCTAINLTGDISGTASTATVEKIRGFAVANTTPSNGQVLKFNGSAWAPETVSGAGTVTSITAGIGLTGGTIASSGTISLTNTGVTAGSYGSPSAIPYLTIDAQGRITSASSNTIAFPVVTVAGRGGAIVIRPSDIVSTASDYFTYKPNNMACTNGQTLTWNSSATRWECGTVMNSITGIPASGDLDGTYPNPIVTKIQSRNIANTTPTEGQVLVYKGANWTPAALGCPSGWTSVSKGAAFCYRSIGNSQYQTAISMCGNLNGNICSINQLANMKLDNVTLSGTYLTDQLSYAQSNGVVPLLYHPTSGSGVLATTMVDYYDAYCCRQKEY